jgi:hypothetical protein
MRIYVLMLHLKIQIKINSPSNYPSAIWKQLNVFLYGIVLLNYIGAIDEPEDIGPIEPFIEPIPGCKVNFISPLDACPLLLI